MPLSTTDCVDKTLIDVKDLHVWYPQKKNWLGKPLTFTKAVDGISFQIREGETIGVVGESGCGKSTLGRALLRLVPIWSGTVKIEGTDLYQETPSMIRKLRRHMQLIFQDPYSSLQPRRTTGDSIQEVLKVHAIGKNHKERMDITIDLLEKVGLSGQFLHKYPHECSGGQRQRIGIARALALHPKFLVCDESVSALDVSVQAQVLNLLTDLKKEYGFTILFISHDLSVVHHISQRMLVMHQGKIVEEGPSEAIFHRPQHPYTQQLMDALPNRKGQINS
jgi:peptide/nickel transport system ATP-binding protein